MRVLFRVDASATIGLGHLVRSLCLARRLVDHGAEVRVLTAAPSSAIIRRIEAVGAAVVRLEEAPGSAADVALTVQEAKHGAAVVVDGYAFDAGYMQCLAQGGTPTVQIDDAGGAVADVVVNGNLYADGMDYPGAGLCLVGPRWSLLDPRFVTAHGIERGDAADPPRLLVSMGGADPTGETLKAFAALEHLPPWPCTVVVGPLAGHGDTIRRAAAARAAVAPTRVLDDVDDMASLLAAHDVAIAAAGTAALELACVGIPALLVAVADNQRPVLQAAATLGTAVPLGWHTEVDAPKIAAGLGALVADPALRRALSTRGRALVDGGGAARVASKIIHLARMRAAS